MEATLLLPALSDNTSRGCQSPMDLKTFTSEIAPAVTATGVIVALWNAQTALRNSRAKNRADWMFQATMTFHKEPKLYSLFHKIDYNEFEFSPKPKSEGGDLGSDKEIELIFFLDFLNGVCAAYEADIFKEEYLVLSTLGYAIQRTAKNPVIGGFLEHVKKHDLKLETKGLYSFGFFRRARTFKSFEHFRDVSDRLEAMGSQIEI